MVLPTIPPRVARLAVLAAVAMAPAVVAQPRPAVPMTQERAAPFAVPSAVDTSKVRLADHAGRVVLVNLWGTWCAPCRRELPAFARLADTLAADGFVVLAVADTESDPDEARALAERFAGRLTVGLDDGSLPASYGPRRLYPSSFLIDRAGRVRLFVAGETSFDEMLPLVRALLAEPVG